jgi:hypothetical protein
MTAHSAAVVNGMPCPRAACLYFRIFPSGICTCPAGAVQLSDLTAAPTRHKRERGGTAQRQ